MAIKVVTAKCPECGAALPVEEDRKQVFCEYCGTKIILENDHEYIYRNIDEAEIKKAETEHIVELKKMEILEKKRASAEKTKEFKIKLCMC